MKFIILMYSDQTKTKALTAAELESIGHKHELLRDTLTRSGELLNGVGMDYPANTTSVRLQNNEPTTSDGALTDAQEQLTAYYVVDCTNRDRALEIGRQILDFHVTSIEVRAIHDSFGLTDTSV